LQAGKISEVTVIVSRWLALLLLLTLVSVPTPCARALPFQSSAPQLPQTPPEEGPAPDEAHRKFEHEQEKRANQERFQKVKDDTEKLVQLSNELKEYVGKANENTLSLDVIKKAEEIERLAKSVKDKMRAN
jgi:hypothetical protein